MINYLNRHFKKVVQECTRMNDYRMKLRLTGVDEALSSKILEALSSRSISRGAEDRLIQAALKGSADPIEVIALCERAPGFLKKEVFEAIKKGPLKWDEIVKFIDFN